MDLAQLLEIATTKKQRRSVKQHLTTVSQAESVESPEHAAAVTIGKVYYGDRSTADKESEIESALQQHDGSLAGLEAILISQVQTLNAVFHHQTRLAALAEGEIADSHLHLALRSQDLTRKSILAIAELRNPKRSVFIGRQTNQVAIRQDGAIAHPHHPHPSPDPRIIQELEASPYAEMDTGGTAAAAGTDPQLATVEIKHRAHQQRGKAKGKLEQLKNGCLQP